MKPVAVQLYSLREKAAQDFHAVLAEVAEDGYAGVEFAGLHGHSAADVAKWLNELGLKACSSHTSMPTAENITQIEDTEKTLGVSRIVTGFGPDAFKTLDDIRRAADTFSQGAALAAEKGLTLGMHNHWWEFDLVDGVYVYDHILKLAPGIFSELDVYWTAFGGADPVAVVKANTARLPLLHIKDGNLTPDHLHTAVGAGKLPMADIINAADPNVLEWLIVELDGCATDMSEAVKQSCQWLISSGLGQGRG